MSRTLAIEAAALAVRATFVVTWGVGGWGGVGSGATGGGGATVFCAVGEVVATPMGTFVPQLVQNFVPGVSGFPHCVQYAIIFYCGLFHLGTM